MFFLSTPRAARIWVLVGLILLAINLRAAITSIPPVLGSLQTTLDLTGLEVSILATLPVLCLGIFASLAPSMARRAGTELALTCALFMITAGILLKVIPSTAALFTGTVLAGAGIAIGNVLMPAVIKHHFAERVGLFTGLAMTLMACSGAISAGLAVPLLDAAGWRVALALWAAPSLAATLVWGFLAPRSRRASTAPTHARARPLLGSPLAWAVAGFLGLVSLGFYVLVAWLPEMAQDDGFTAAEAGTMASVMLTIGIPLGFAIPVAAVRLHDQRPLVIGVVAMKVVGLGGVLLAPQADWIWVSILGLATGSAFPLAITLLSLRSPSPLVAAQLSGMAQTGGYLLAGTGPLAIGMLHTATSGWNAPLLLLLALAIPETAFGLLAARPGFVGHTGTGRVAVGTEEEKKTLASPVR